MKYHVLSKKIMILGVFLPILYMIIFPAFIFSEEISQKKEILRTQWNLVRWHDPEMLREYLNDAKIVPEGNRWCEEVEQLIDELSFFYPACEKESISETEKKLLRKKILKKTERERSSEDADEKTFRFQFLGNKEVKPKKTVLEWDFQDAEIRQQRAFLLQKLNQKSEEVSRILVRTQNIPFITRLGRANFALQRRLAVWRYCDAIMNSTSEYSAQNIYQVIDFHFWNQTLMSVRELIQNHPYADTWATYIRYGHLVHLTQIKDLRKQREIAQSVLVRLDRSRLNDSQKKFISQRPFQILVGELLKVARLRSPEDYLLYSLEEYESANQISEGNHLAAECLRGWFLQDSEKQNLLQYVEYSYRNANIRLEISSEFLNRLVPQRGPETMTINEYILNRPVYGRGVTSTNIQVQMIPDPQRFRLGFMVEGSVESSTVSQASMVRVANNSEANFNGLKEVELTERGMLSAPAVATVANRVQMRHLKTSLDIIPLVGIFANEVARSQARNQQELARLESQEKIRRQVIASLDDEVNFRLQNVNSFWQERILAPLGRLGIDFRQLDAETTEETATVRWRLAGADQLGGHTPRPLAMPNNLLNFQIHESAINNFLQQLKLDGKTFTLPQLHEHIAVRFPKWRERVVEDEDIPEDLVISFPPTDALSVKLADGHIMLQLSISSLRIGEHHWENFKIHVPYRVETKDFQAQVHRDGVIRLIGRMKLKQQIAVRGVFSKVFPKDTVTNVLPEYMTQDQRFATFKITQCVMQDGWMGISLGESSRGQNIMVRQNTLPVYR
ncbi:MAG: hypothetical protein Q4C96_03550 [Planctomycetia bacterium]|nr:hypothetical protein [Planctomycetia bacterium]